MIPKGMTAEEAAQRMKQLKAECKNTLPEAHTGNEASAWIAAKWSEIIAESESKPSSRKA